MTIRDFFAGFSLDIANVTICTENYDTLVCGTIHFNSQSDYRLEELEKKVDKHNNLVDRMYCVEDSTNRQADELKRVNERLRIVEGGARA